MYDRFSGIKFWSGEWNTENKMSHLCFNEKSDYFKDICVIYVKMKSFAPT